MTVCFFCGNKRPERRMHSERICEKRICQWCYDTMDNTEFMPREREVALRILIDAKGRADLDRSGGRFKRHKG